MVNDAVRQYLLISCLLVGAMKIAFFIVSISDCYAFCGAVVGGGDAYFKKTLRFTRATQKRASKFHFATSVSLC